jgi:hypothetical protein
MDPVARLGSGASGALRLGRGLADRAIRFTAPPITRAVGQLAQRRPVRRRTTRESTPTTFTPSKRR